MAFVWSPTHMSDSPTLTPQARIRILRALHALAARHPNPDAPGTGWIGGDSLRDMLLQMESQTERGRKAWEAIAIVVDRVGLDRVVGVIDKTGPPDPNATGMILG